MDKLAVSLAGEFFVLAQLSLKGLVGTLTLGHTKNIDVIVSNPKTGNLFRIEVKTTTKGSVESRQFGCNLEWIMNKKHEDIFDDKLFYCFVELMEDKMPKFFIVPSKEVSNYVKKEHEYWSNLQRKKEVNVNNTMRIFRIALDDEAHGLKALDYLDKWDFFD